MKVREIMTPSVETVSALDTVRDAAAKMLARNVGALPVYEGSILLGLLTDRDITVRAVAKGLDPRKTLVEDVMTWKAGTCLEDREVSEAVKIMEDQKVRRLVVLDRHGRLQGIVSLSDVATRAHDRDLVEELLESVASRARDPREGPA